MTDLLSSEKLILGVDGGGTKTAIALAKVCANGQQQVLGTAITGASNMLAVGHDIALQNLEAGIEQVFTEAGLAVQKVAVAVLGLAGSFSSDVTKTINQWANDRGLADNIEIVSDIEPVLMAGTPENIGVSLIVGTGTVARGVNQAGKSLVLGGWGHWYGDQGSGYDLGRQGIMAAVNATDGVGPQTSLLPAIFEQFGINDSRDIIVAMERTGDVRSTIASLSALVVKHAEADDLAAKQIVQQGVDHCAGLVAAAATQLALPEIFPLALAGGVICGSPSYQQWFKEALQQRKVAVGETRLVVSPVDGCLLMALKLLANG